MTDPQPDLRTQLIAQADYLEHGGDHSGIPATVETDSDVWRTSIRLLRAAAEALAVPSPREEVGRVRILHAIQQAKSSLSREEIERLADVLTRMDTLPLTETPQPASTDDEG